VVKTGEGLKRLAAVLPALAVLLMAGVSWAEAEPEGWAYELASQLMSPYCPGRTLSDCPSPQAGTLRMWIIVQESAGRSKDEVLEELYARFGDQVRAAPRAEGFGIAAYAIPVLAFLGGGILVGVFLRRHTAASGDVSASKGAAASGPLDPELERLVDEDLAR
jgi:cytochrome c-type biogenesis protein CcmH/NrfF